MNGMTPMEAFIKGLPAENQSKEEERLTEYIGAGGWQYTHDQTYYLFPGD